MNEFEHFKKVFMEHEFETGERILLVDFSVSYFNKVKDSEQYYKDAHGIVFGIPYHTNENQEEDYIFRQ